MDKLALVLCCMPLAALDAEAPAVVPLLVAVIAACLGEVVPPRQRTWPSIAYAVAAVFAQALLPFLPLAAYDLARPSGHDASAAEPARSLPRPAARALMCAAPIAVAAAGGSTSPLACGLSVGLCLAAALMAARTHDVEVQRSANHRQRDALREQALSLAEKNRDLMDRQDYQVRVAVLEERSRIARSIHDNVGHLLTRSILQTQAQQVLHAEEPAMCEAFTQIGATLNEALDTVRASVHDLHDDSIDLAAQMRATLEGAPCPVSSTIQVEAAPAAVANCLVAVTREALSNVARHSDASRIELSLVEHPGFWRLSIADNGSSEHAAASPASAGDAVAFATSTGLGLTSMEERVRALGGTFSAGPRPSEGFAVFASIPKDNRSG